MVPRSPLQVEDTGTKATSAHLNAAGISQTVASRGHKESNHSNKGSGRRRHILTAPEPRCAHVRADAVCGPMLGVWGQAPPIVPTTLQGGQTRCPGASQTTASRKPPERCHPS